MFAAIGPAPLDILVNNAGIAGVGTVQQTTEADMDRLYRVNVKGVYFCALEAVNSMVAGGKGGVIINLASIASLVRCRPAWARYRLPLPVTTRYHPAVHDRFALLVCCLFAAWSLVQVGLKDRFAYSMTKGAVLTM